MTTAWTVTGVSRLVQRTLSVRTVFRVFFSAIAFFRFCDPYCLLREYSNRLITNL